MSENYTAQMRLDLSQLITALNNGVKGWNKFVEAQDLALSSTIITNDKLEILRATLKRVDQEGNTVAETYKRTAKGFVRSTRIVKDETKALMEKEAVLKAAQKAKEEAAEAERRLNEQAANRAARFAQGQGGTVGVPTTLLERNAVAKAVENLRLLVFKHRQTGEQVQKIWAEVSRGEIKRYTGELFQLQQRIIAVQSAQSKLGNTFRKSEAGKEADEIKRLAKESKELQISWQAVARIELFSLARRGLFAFLNNIKQSIEAAAEFQVLIAQIRTISESTVPFDNWSASLRRLSDSWGLDILDQATAAYEALSNQVADGAQTFLFLEQANKLALTGISTTAQAADLLSAAINAYNLNIDNAARLSAVFFKTVDLGRVKIEDLANQYGRIATPAHTLGITIEELNAAIATLTIRGIKYTESATFLRGIIQKLIKPTDKMKDLFADLGVANAEAAFETFGFAGFLAILDERTQGVSSELAELFNRVRPVTGAMGLAGKGLEQYNDNLQEIIRSSVDFNEKTQEILNTSGKNFQIELNQIKNIFVKDFATPVIDALKALHDRGIDLSELVTGVAKAVVFVLIPVVTTLITKLTLVNNLVKTLFLNWKRALQFLGVELLVLFATQARRTEQAVTKATAELTEQMAKAAQEQRVFWNEMAAIVEQTFKAQAQAANQALASVLSLFNRESKIAKATFEDLNKFILDSIKVTAKSIKNEERLISSTLSNIQRKIQQGKTNLETTAFQSERLLFDFSLESAPAIAQIDLIEDRIDELRQRSRVAAQSGDQSTFNKLRNEIINLLLKQKSVEESSLGTLNLKVDKSVELKQIISEELTLQRQLLSVLEKQRSVELNKQAQLKLQQADLDRLLARYKEFDIGDILKLDDTDKIQQLALQQVKTLESLREQASTFGVDPKAFENETQIIVSAVANRLKELQLQATAEDLRFVRKERLDEVKELQSSLEGVNSELLDQLEIVNRLTVLFSKRAFKDVNASELLARENELNLTDLAILAGLPISTPRQDTIDFLKLIIDLEKLQTQPLNQQVENLEKIQEQLNILDRVGVPSPVTFLNPFRSVEDFFLQIGETANLLREGGQFEENIKTAQRIQETLDNLYKDKPTPHQKRVQELDTLSTRLENVNNLRQKEIELIETINGLSRIQPLPLPINNFKARIDPTVPVERLNLDRSPSQFIGPVQPNNETQIFNFNFDVQVGPHEQSSDAGEAIFNSFMSEARRQGIRIT